jgi:hypothetical protein
MYSDTKTYNPFIGCKFDCIYCKKSFKRVLKRVGLNIKCILCYNYVPHTHPERLKRIPSSPIVFVFGQGDIYFCAPQFVEQTFKSIEAHKPRKPKIYYFQSKAPSVFNRYLDWFNGNQDKVILLTTLETNRDEGYRDISKAPLPTTRFRDFLMLDYPRKVLTIEPILDFDLLQFTLMVTQLHDQGTLEYVWFGFDSKNCGLPEPSTEKAQRFVDGLQTYGIEVRGKTLRDLTLSSAEAGRFSGG